MSLIQKACHYLNGRWPLTPYAAEVGENLEIQEKYVRVGFALETQVNGVCNSEDRIVHLDVPSQSINNSRLDETVKGQWNRIISRPLFANNQFYGEYSSRSQKVGGFFKARILVAGHLLLAIPKAFVDVLSKIAFIAEKAFATLTTLFKGEFKEAKIQFTACANAVGALALRPIVLGLDLIKLSAGLLCLRAAINFDQLDPGERKKARIQKKTQKLVVLLATKTLESQGLMQSPLSTNGALKFIQNPNFIDNNAGDE